MLKVRFILYDMCRGEVREAYGERISPMTDLYVARGRRFNAYVFAPSLGGSKVTRVLPGVFGGERREPAIFAIGCDVYTAADLAEVLGKAGYLNTVILGPSGVKFESPEQMYKYIMETAEKLEPKSMVAAPLKLYVVPPSDTGALDKVVASVLSPVKQTAEGLIRYIHSIAEMERAERGRGRGTADIIWTIGLIGIMFFLIMFIVPRVLG